MELQKTGWQRRGWLALVVGVHVVAFLCWQPTQQAPAMHVARHEAITYILTPVAPARRPVPPPVAVPTVPVPRAAPAVPAARIAQIAPTAAAEADTAAPVAQAGPAVPSEPQPITLPAHPFALPAKPEADLKQRAIAGAFAADKAVRKESFTQRDRKLVNDETALAAAIGKAYRGGGTRMVEMVSPDGSRITKVILPGGAAVCYYSAPNSPGGGRDPFRDSGRVTARSCPR